MRAYQNDTHKRFVTSTNMLSLDFKLKPNAIVLSMRIKYHKNNGSHSWISLKRQTPSLEFLGNPN